MNLIMLGVLSAFLMAIMSVAILNQYDPNKPVKEVMIYLLFIGLFSAGTLLAYSFIGG